MRGLQPARESVHSTRVDAQSHRAGTSCSRRRAAAVLGAKEEKKRTDALLPLALQAAIGSTALDMAVARQDDTLKKYGMDVLTMAVLAILLTAPVGALIIGLAGPRLLQRPKTSACGERVKPTLSAFFLGT